MSASKKRQTMAKMARERALKEKRALKLEKKRAAADLRLMRAMERANGQSPDQPVTDLRLVATDPVAPPAEQSHVASGSTEPPATIRVASDGLGRASLPAPD